MANRAEHTIAGSAAFNPSIEQLAVLRRSSSSSGAVVPQGAGSSRSSAGSGSNAAKLHGLMPMADILDVLKERSSKQPQAAAAASSAEQQGLCTKADLRGLLRSRLKHPSVTTSMLAYKGPWTAFLASQQALLAAV
jgi:hypothetical protein